MLSYIEYNYLIIPFMTAIYNNNRNYAIAPTVISDIQRKGSKYEVTFDFVPEPFVMDNDPCLEHIMLLSPEQYETNTRAVIITYPDNTYSVLLMFLDEDFPSDKLEFELDDRTEIAIIKDCIESLNLNTTEKVDRFIQEGQELYEKYMNNLHEEPYSKILYMQDEVD